MNKNYLTKNNKEQKRKRPLLYIIRKWPSQTYSSSTADFKIEEEVINCLVLLVLQVAKKLFEVRMQTYLFDFFFSLLKT